MADNTLGLIFEIVVDPTRAEKAVEDFSKSLDKSLGLAKGKSQEYATAIEKHFGLAEGTMLRVGQASVAAGKDLLYLGGVAGAVGLGALALANKWAEAGTEIFEAAEKTGIAAEKLSGLRATAQVLDENFGAVTITVARMGRVIETGLRDSGSEAGKTLQQLFKSTKELNELALLPAEDRVARVSQKIFELNSVNQQNIALTALAGRGYNEVRSTMQELGTHGYDPMIERARKLGQFFDDESAAKARQFRIELREMKVEAEGLALRIGQQLVPAMSQLVAITEVKLQQSLGKNLVQAARDAGVELSRIQLMLMTAGASEIFFSDKLNRTELALTGGNTEIQKMTNGLVAANAMTQSAAKSTDDLGDANNKAGKATKDHSDHLRKLSSDMREAKIIVPALTEEIYHLAKAQEDAATRRKAEEIFGLPKAPQLGLPSGAAPGSLGEAGGLPDLSPSLKRTNETADQTVYRLSVMIPRSTSIASQAMKEMGLTFDGVAKRFSQGMAEGVTQAILYGRSVGEAVRMAMKATIASIAGEAMVRALFETALGFAALARWDVRSAALHFKSAAVFGVVAGTAGAVAAAIPGAKDSSAVIGAGSQGGSAEGRQASDLTPAEQQVVLASGAHNAVGAPSGPLTVMVVGEPQAASYVAGMLNRHVSERDGQLIASQAKAPVTAGR